MLGTGLDRLRFPSAGPAAGSPAAGWNRGALVAALGLAALLPLVPRWPYPAGSPVTPFFFSSRLVDRIAPGSVVVTYPFPDQSANQALAWQAAASMRFRLLGGTTFFVPGVGGRTVENFRAVCALSPPGIDRVFKHAFFGGSRIVTASRALSPALVSAIIADFRRYHVSTVVIDRGLGGVDPAAAVRYVTAAAGHGPESAGGVLVWSHLRLSQA